MATELPGKHCMSLWVRNGFLYPWRASFLRVSPSLFFFFASRPPPSTTSPSLTDQLLPVSKSCAVEGDARRKRKESEEDCFGVNKKWNGSAIRKNGRVKYWNRKEMMNGTEEIMIMRSGKIERGGEGYRDTGGERKPMKETAKWLIFPLWRHVSVELHCHS